MSIYTHFYNIGADRQILVTSEDEETRKQRNRAILHKYFYILVVQNPLFPGDIPIVFVLDHFFELIVQNKIELKGYNPRSHIQAFHSYISNYKHELRSRWHAHQHPNSRSKALTPESSYSDQEKKQQKTNTLASLVNIYGSKDKVPDNLKKFLED